MIGVRLSRLRRRWRTASWKRPYLGMRLPRLFLVLAAIVPALAAQREPVLRQIDLPHPYYYREMYLPQLTSGPSSVAWSPDSTSVVYSMQGSLWRQALDSTVAEQLTSGPGYDYQPDWSPDGHWLVYASYYKGALELELLDLATGRSQPLTSGGNVNLEPRWSPDGRRLIFVSTAYNRRFHIFVARVENGKLESPERLTGESRSPLPRYYYSEFDHEISPVWSRDGKEIVFISNRGHIHGSGGLWRMEARPGAEERELHYEETTWKARPDWSPDGKRLVYSSYLGQQWHQLWTIPADGGDAFPLSYGEFDNTAPRWSPDGKHIAFISNRGGNTSLWILDVMGGGQRQILAKERRYLKPMGRLRIAVLGPAGKPVSARLSETGEDQRAYAPDDAWIHADEAFARSERPFEAHYFHTHGVSEVTVPAGRVLVEAMKGLEYRPARAEINVAAGEVHPFTLHLEALPLPSTPLAPEGRQKRRWLSGDLHVHMNYGGTYRNTPANLVFQGEAEGLGVIQALVVNKEQRIPDISYFRSGPDPASTSNTTLMYGQEFHTNFWGHTGLLNLKDHSLLPDYAGYPNTSAASLYPTNALVADMARRQGGLLGYVHPFDSLPDPAKEEVFGQALELPIDVALGKVDYYEVVGFSNHRASAEVWYKLLNLGFRLPAGAGTDAMPNFASLHGPVGNARVFVKVPAGPVDPERWLQGLQRGESYASNGPLLGFALGGKQIGDDLHLPAGGDRVGFTAWMRSIVPVDHLQVVCNGDVLQQVELSAARDSADARGVVPISHSGWCVLRSYSETPRYPVLDIYPYATTSPIYIRVGNEEAHSPADATYFVAWIDRVAEMARAHTGWNSETEKEEVMKVLSQARAVYEEKSRR